MDKKGGRRRHISRVLWHVWSVDVPDDVHISIYILYITFGLHHAHTERVHCGRFVPAQSSDQPATKLKSLIDSNTEFYVMFRRATDGIDQGPLTANLQGGYSIVSDPETTLKPIVVPYMMSENGARGMWTSPFVLR
jgi:hypothetical protein